MNNLIDIYEKLIARTHKQYSAAELERIELFVASFGNTELKVPEGSQQNPGRAYFPGLRTQPFWSSSDWSWLSEIEARLLKYPAIADEVAAHLKCAQWPEYGVNRYLPKNSWTVKVLFEGNSPGMQEDAYNLFPSTCEALEPIRHKLLAAGFLRLAPKTRIPRHTDPNNTALTYLYGLIVPPECGISVAGESRAFRKNSAICFDQTLPHEAWNDSNEPRVVLVLDLPHPDLTPIELDIIKEIQRKNGEFH